MSREQQEQASRLPVRSLLSAHAPVAVPSSSPFQSSASSQLLPLETSHSLTGHMQNPASCWHTPTPLQSLGQSLSPLCMHPRAEVGVMVRQVREASFNQDV
jgi:hypothetical protein